MSLLKPEGRGRWKIIIAFCFLVLLINIIPGSMLSKNMIFADTVDGGPGSRATPIYGMHVTTNTTWTESNSPYQLNGNIAVDQGATLTLETGTEVKVMGNFNIFIEGSLKANGSIQKPVKISGSKNQPGSWGSLQVNSSGKLILKYTELSYGTTNIILDGSSNNTIENSKSFKGKERGLRAIGSNGNRILNSSFYQNTMSGIYLLGSTNNKIINSIFHNNSKSGILEYYSSGNEYADCIIEYNNENGLHSFESDGISVTGCISRKNTNGFIFGTQTGGSVTDTISKYNLNIGIYVHFTNNSMFIRSYSIQNKIGMGLLNSTNNIFDNLTIIRNTNNGLELEDSSNNHIKNSEISYQGGYGIHAFRGQMMLGSPGNSITECNIRGNSNGIHISRSPGTYASALMVFGSTNGIYVSYSPKFTCSDLKLSNNLNGLILFESSDSSITDCNISDNGNGVRTWRCTDTKITYSLFKNNTAGIFLGTDSKRCMVHHNYILNNSLNGGDSNPGNFWDDKVGAGNYWSNYNGTDVDHNGIGDQVHPVTNFSSDRWPLVDDNNTVLKILSTKPYDDQILVDVNTSVELSFSEIMVTGSIIGKVSFTPGVDILGYSWSRNDRNVTIQLAQLTRGTTYRVKIENAGIVSITGKPLKFPYYFRFTTLDPENPRIPYVVDHNPKGDDVAIDSVVNITFSEPMHRISVEQAVSVKPYFEFEFIWENDTVISLHPAANFTFLTNYTVTVSTTAKNLIGNALNSSYIFSFITEKDRYPPYIVDFYPSGDVPVPVDIGSIMLLFNEPVDTTSVADHFYMTPEIEGNFEWPDENMTLFINITSDLNYDTEYSVTLEPGVVDLSGNPTTEPFEFSFRTVEKDIKPPTNDTEPDTVPPYIIDYFPSSTVPLSVHTKMVIIVFSESVDTNSVEERFTITPPAAGKFKWKDLNSTLYYEFDSELLFNTSYILRLLPGYTDRTGNANTELFEMIFTTVFGISPFTILKYSPAGIDIPVDTKITITLNKNSDHATVETAFFIEPYIGGSFSWLDTTLIFEPNADLEFNTTYIILIKGTARDIQGIYLEGPFSWDFTTELKSAPDIEPDTNGTPVDGNDTGPDDNIPPDTTDNGSGDRTAESEKNARVMIIVIIVLILILIAAYFVLDRYEESRRPLSSKPIVITRVKRQIRGAEDRLKMLMGSHYTKPVENEDLPKITGERLKPGLHAKPVVITRKKRAAVKIEHNKWLGLLKAQGRPKSGEPKLIRIEREEPGKSRPHKRISTTTRTINKRKRM